MLELTPRQALLAEEFLGNIKEDGYLAASLEEILRTVNELLDSSPSGTGADSEEDWPRSRSSRPSPRREPAGGARAIPLLHAGRGRGDAAGSSSGSTRPASARATCASACCSSSGSQGDQTRSPTAWWRRRSPT